MDEGQKDKLVQSSLDFIRAITDIYGTEKGMELWATIADTIDPAVKGEIFLAMLEGRQSVITVTGYQGNYKGTNKVDIVKAIRNASAAPMPSLKEAVDLADTLASGRPIKIKPESGNRMVAINILTKAGLEVA